MEAEILEVEWARGRYDQLNLIDETRTKAMYHTHCTNKGFLELSTSMSSLDL
ncbi:conserved hypothetical protein [Ricinus communis]|uniref:Uncharacterized protein n=1 Tax=Ricinus communis TaxID=3988 RepID=B9SBS1_RICCO|nr:conserved hypothetical protein [Ricinus communis]